MRLGHGCQWFGKFWKVVNVSKKWFIYSLPARLPIRLSACLLLQQNSLIFHSWCFSITVVTNGLNNFESLWMFHKMINLLLSYLVMNTYAWDIWPSVCVSVCLLVCLKSSVIDYKYSWKFGYDLKHYLSCLIICLICHSLCPSVPLCVCSRRTYRLATELAIIFCNKYLVANGLKTFVSKNDLSVCLLGNCDIQSGKNYSVSNETKWNE